MRYFLTGFAGVGKTTIGRELALIADLPFIDLDEQIETSTKISISDYFEQYGEKAFRELERKHLLLAISSHDNCVISLGGGTICYHLNHLEILSSGTLIYLQVSWAALYSRLKNLDNRPKVKGKNEDEMKALFRQREPFYELAQLKMPVNSGFSAQKLAFFLKLSTNR
jgi:shikimate kinase